MKHIKFNTSQKGFTLLELMTVVSIVAIIAAIGIPSYSAYFIKNSESQAIAEIKQVEIQLEKWKASKLSYKGFIPSRGSDICSGSENFCYDEADNITMYVPKGSDSSNYDYKISVLDESNDKSLVPDQATTEVDVSAGRTWKIIAIPNTTGTVKNANKFIVSSVGIQCKTTGTGISNASDDCGNHHSVEQW